MYDRMLVPTDGSDAAVAAAKAAFALARRFDADLYAIHVLESSSADLEYGEQLVAAIAEAAVEVGVETATDVVYRKGSVPETLIASVEEHDIDCIVMGTHGRTAVREYVLGSVAERTLREAPVPVVTVHEDTVVTGKINRVLVPTDGSECAAAAIDHASTFAEEVEASLHLAHVVDSDVGGEDGDVYDALESTGQDALEAGIEAAHRAAISEVEASLLSGRPHEAIRAYVEENDIDYVFMGTHGRTGVSRYLLGSVTERVVRLVERPVVSVKDRPPD